MNAKTYNITQQDKFMYNITLSGNYTKMIYKMLKIVIKNSFYDEPTNSLFFNAEHVNSLSLNTVINKSHQCITLIDHISKQINYLYTLGYGYYGFDTTDIIVIDNNIYAIVNTNYVSPIINDTFTFYSPIAMPYFSSPELYTNKILPTILNYKTCYYSLGALILHYLLNEHISVTWIEGINDMSNIEKLLYPLHHTKIYWFLKRCFDTTSNKRILLLI